MDGHDLLLPATAVLLGGVLVPLMFPRWPLWARALWRVLAFVALTGLGIVSVGSPLHPRLGVPDSWERLWQQLVIVGWWIMAARSVAAIAGLLLGLQNRTRETKILSDLIGAGIYAATALGIVDVVFAVPIGGLIATSGVIAVVIGLALQSTLSDVFSGIAIDIERPYRAGDLIWVEGGIEGQVREVNWRSTLVVTGSGDIATVPNSIMAKSRLINHSLPGPTRSTTVEVRVDPRVMPDRCHAALEAALQACLRPLAHPAPIIQLAALKGDGARYDIIFSVENTLTLGAARAEVLAQVQRHLFHAAIPLAVDGLMDVRKLEVPTAGMMLAASDLFGNLTSRQRERLAAEMTDVGFDPGAVLFAQGGVVEAMYLIAAGTIGIRRQRPEGGELDLRMSPGSCLGIIGLVTGEPVAATATALTPVRAFRLDRAGIAAAIEAEPKLKAALEESARRTRATIREDAATGEDRQADQPDMFLSRMRSFLSVLAGDMPRGLR